MPQSISKTHQGSSFYFGVLSCGMYYLRSDKLLTALEEIRMCFL